ncbi:MAG: MFS transporter, partial [Planctomycetales bacterium]|nr:MFS transporter [Planctomycetales bacterium]
MRHHAGLLRGVPVCSIVQTAAEKQELMGQGQGKASSQGEEARTAIRGLSIRISVFYGALFVILGMHVPFTPVWLASRGLSAGEISAILAVPFFLRVLVTPTLALSADRRDCHRRYMIMLA